MAERQIAPLSARVCKNPQAKYQRLDASQIAEARRLRSEERLGVQAIADHFSVTKGTISRYVSDIPEPIGGFSVMSRSERGKRAGSIRRAIVLPPRTVAPREFDHLTTSQKGKLAELYFEAECILCGVSANDYLVMFAGAMKRVQVKWADSQSAADIGAIYVTLAKPRGLRSAKKTSAAYYDKSEIDLVAAYVPAFKQFVIFGSDLFHQRHGVTVRVDAPRNKQVKGIRFAKDFFWHEHSLS